MKFINKKYTSFLMGMLVILLTMTSITSCESCKKTENKEGDKTDMPFFELLVEGLDQNGFINDTNKFIIKINKTGGKIKEESSNLEIDVTSKAGVNGARLKDGVNLIKFIASDIKNGVIERELEIVPGSEETEFTLALKYKGKVIAHTKKTVKCSNGAKLDITPATTYDPIAKTVTVEIKNIGKIDLGVHEAKLAWDSGNDAITIEGNRSADQDIPEIKVGGTYLFTLNNIHFTNPLVASFLELKLTWDKLGNNVIKNDIVLAEDADTAKVFQGQAEVEAAFKQIGIELAKNTAVGFQAAAAEIAKAEAGLQKAKDAQTALGGAITDAVKGAVQKAEQTANNAKNAYNTAIAKKEQAAMEGQAEVEAAFKKIVIELAKNTALGFQEAAAEIKKVEAAGLQKARDAQTALGGAASDKVKNAVQKAEQQVHEAKRVYSIAIKPFRDNYLKIVMENGTKTKTLADNVNNSILAKRFMDVANNIVEMEAVLKNAQKAQLDFKPYLLADDITIDTTIVEATAAVAGAKSAVENEALTWTTKAEAELGQANTALSQTPKRFEAARNALYQAEAHCAIAKNALNALIFENIVTLGSKADNAVKSFTTAIKNTRSIFEKALEAEVTERMVEVEQKRTIIFTYNRASDLKIVKEKTEAVKAAANHVLELAKLSILRNENIPTRSIKTKDAANGAIKHYNGIQLDHQLHIAEIPA